MRGAIYDATVLRGAVVLDTLPHFATSGIFLIFFSLLAESTHCLLNTFIDLISFDLNC